MGKLKLGIIGTGGICNNKHLPSLAKVADKVEVAALCDLDESKAKATAERHGLTNAAIYTDYRELLKDESIDIVHVCTPNVAHCQITVDAFAAGKHVLCEKPMAATTEDAQKMLDAWRKSGKKFTVGYQNRFRYDVQVLKKACDAGELGDIYYGEANAIRRKAVPTWGVFPDKSKQGGGPLIDIGTHALDITLWCMNNYDVDSVSGQVFYKLGNLPEAAQGNTYGPWNTDTFEVEDSAMGFIKMKNGALINLRASWALNYMDAREASTTLCGTLEGAEIKHGGSYPQSELWFNHVRHGKMTHETLSGEALVDYFEGVNEPAGVVEAKQIFFVSLGIVLCKKCNLGISPISSIPFVLEEIVPLSFGTLTMLFHLVNILFQLILLREVWNLRILLQIPVAFLFGQVIDLLQRLIHFDSGFLAAQVTALILSIFFTALGMVCMIRMDLVQNPPDGLVKILSQKTGRELGRIKILYDAACVVISAALGLAILGEMRGMGIATVVSAVFVGRTVTWMKEKAFLLNWL